jgi:tryptophan-rich sensory protein
MTPSEIMMERMHKHPAATSVLTCLGMVLLGMVLAGDGLETWYVNLEKPAFLVPLWSFYVVGVLYYLLFGVVIYRIAAYMDEAAVRSRLLGLTVAVMLLNELWNFAFLGMQSTLAGFVGIVIFLVPLLILIVRLVPEDRIGGGLLIGYSVWVAYDIAWTYALWQLNA